MVGVWVATGDRGAVVLLAWVDILFHFALRSLRHLLSCISGFSDQAIGARLGSKG